MRLTKGEVFFACQALADADRCLVRAGRPQEAGALVDLFELLEARMVVDDTGPVDTAPVDTAPVDTGPIAAAPVGTGPTIRGPSEPGRARPTRPGLSSRRART